MESPRQSDSRRMAGTVSSSTHPTTTVQLKDCVVVVRRISGLRMASVCWHGSGRQESTPKRPTKRCRISRWLSMSLKHDAAHVYLVDHRANATPASQWQCTLIDIFSWAQKVVPRHCETKGELEPRRSCGLAAPLLYDWIKLDDLY